MRLSSLKEELKQANIVIKQVCIRFGEIYVVCEKQKESKRETSSSKDVKKTISPSPKPWTVDV